MTTKTQHGGVRQGAGRPPKPPGPPLTTTPIDDTPLGFLLAVMRDESQPTDRRTACAVAALPYCHARAVPVTGTKAAAKAAASAASSEGGKFAPRRAPLAVVPK